MADPVTGTQGKGHRLMDVDLAEDLFSNRDGTTIGEWTKVTEQREDSGRWMEYFTLILKHEDGTFWGISFARGLTESQESEYPWRPGYGEERGPVELSQVSPRQVVSTIYE